MELKQITLNFAGTDFTINGIGGHFDLKGFAKQVVDLEGENLNPQIRGFKNIKDLNQWTRSLSEKAIGFYEIVSRKGRYGGTTCNEKGVYAFASWVNEEFGFAVIEAFEAAVNGNGEQAVEVAQKFARTAIREDSIDHTKKLAGIVQNYFGNYLTRDMLRVIHNHANRKMFGMETEELREKAREITGSKAKKISHRDLYEDMTTLRITGMMANLSLRIKQMQGKALSPNEVVQGIILAIDEIAEVQGGAEAPEYLPEDQIKKVNQKKVSK
ncbi:MAG: hypothetical protein ACRDCE_11460 [Cetobacterium sp.]|uniref:hypothetical protein n=1 Tax=Cetobacterium sp. TaxID=2071632 RepID=UPI003EE6EFFC